MMQSMVPELRLSAKQRGVTQLLVFAALCLAVVGTLRSTRPILDSLEPEAAGPVKALPIWVVPVVLLLALIPGAFVFLLFKYQFDFMDEREVIARGG